MNRVRSMLSATVLGQLQCSSSSSITFGIRSWSQIAEAGVGTNSDRILKATEESLDEVRARVFGIHLGNGLRTGRKYLRRHLLGPKLVSYYPTDPVKMDPLMSDLDEERAKAKLDRLRRRGKSPPKKGAGKRSGK